MIKTALIFVNISAVFNVNYYEVFSFCTSKRKPLRFSCLLFYFNSNNKSTVFYAYNKRLLIYYMGGYQNDL